MQSRLLTSLDQVISSSEDALTWARAMCRSASHLARQGQSSLALERIASVRSHFGTDLQPEIACWLMLAEGVLGFFQLRQSDAHDRLRRAYVLSKAFQVDRARPSCASWMAHIEFNESRYDSMCAYIVEAFEVATPDDHQARARASLVMADALHFAGSFTKARPWYEAARQHATAEGDEATLSALFHNIAAFRAANVRLADAYDTALPSEAKRASMEAASALHYDRAVGTESFNTLVPLLQAQLLIVDRRFQDAASLLDLVAQESVPRRLLPVLAIDRALCAFSLEHLEAGRTAAAEALDSDLRELDIDDRAYVLARYSQLARRFNLPARDSDNAAVALLAEFRDFQDTLLTRLESVASDLRP